MIYSHGPIRPLRRRRRNGFRFELDIPGPYKLEWSPETARDRIQRRREISREAIPVVTGIAAAAAPYVVGATIVAFAPPWWKPVGVSMMVPTGAGEVFWFGVGYYAGTQIESQIPDWML